MSEPGNKTGRRVAPRVDTRAEPTSKPPPPPTDVLGTEVVNKARRMATGERPAVDPSVLNAPRVPAAERPAVDISDLVPPTPAAPVTTSPKTDAPSTGDTAKRAAIVARVVPTAAAVPANDPPLPDPRFARIETMLSTNDWDGVRMMLGPVEDGGALPPALGLLLSVAQKEMIQGPAAQREDSPENALAIRCAAKLMGVSETSAAALIVAKRLLRRNRNTIGTQPAPRWWNSAAIILAGIALGALVGYTLVFGPFASNWGGTHPAARSVARPHSP